MLNQNFAIKYKNYLFFSSVQLKPFSDFLYLSTIAICHSFQLSHINMTCFVVCNTKGTFYFVLVFIVQPFNTRDVTENNTLFDIL